MGVCDPPSEGVKDMVHAAWDWTATTHPAEDLELVLLSVAADRGVPGKGLHGWPIGLDLFDKRGDRVAKIFTGGGTETIHVLATSGVADSVRESVTKRPCKTARVDTCVDSLVKYEDLVSSVLEVAGPQTKITVFESFKGSEQLGRTVYVGAPTSAVRLRIYEKHLESPGLFEPGTNRIEVQLRPPSRSKEAVSTWDRWATFGASKLSRRVGEVLGQKIEPAGSLEKKRGTPTLEESLEAMGKQYGPSVERFLALSGGDLDTVLGHLLRS